ncbi:hypothetical protein HYT02_04360 [Candidatus Gottesmanbacteria bacterium]|nr:hypothetical protein [Candidatus Gottesmanbacteria bacterium]
MKCAKCGMDTQGWKCAICGSEDTQHDDTHIHGEPSSSRYCMPKCKGCNQAEVHCTC